MDNNEWKNERMIKGSQPHKIGMGKLRSWWTQRLDWDFFRNVSNRQTNQLGGLTQRRNRR